MATIIDYECRVRILPKQNQQPRHINEESLQYHSKATLMFPVQFSLSKVRLLIQRHERILMQTPRPRSTNKTAAFFPVTDHSLLGQIQDFKVILTGMGIPENSQSDMLQKTESVAQTMDSYDGVYMEVKILEWHRQWILHRVEEDDMARAERESMEINEARPFPATKSSIDALERVVFDGLGSGRDCTVCLEEIEAGSEAIRMPCSHVYHSDCIVQWLQTSHLCPLCRYHMPCEL